MLKYTIAAAAVLLSAGAAWACPSWQAGPGDAFSFSTTQLATPHRTYVVAGGNNNLSRCANGWWGYAITSPDVTVNYARNTNGRALEFRTQGSGCDTVLLVNDAYGNWYFDDDGGSGLNARIRLSNAAGGQYDVWVGTFGPSNCSTELVFETWR